MLGRTFTIEANVLGQLAMPEQGGLTSSLGQPIASTSSSRSPGASAMPSMFFAALYLRTCIWQVDLARTKASGVASPVTLVHYQLGLASTKFRMRGEFRGGVITTAKGQLPSLALPPLQPR